MRIGQMSMALLNRMAGSVVSSTLLEGLINYWPMRESSGTRDDPVGGLYLSDVNTVGAVFRGPAGRVAKFSYATNEYLSLASPGISLGGRSVAFWVRVKDFSTTRAFFSLGATPTSGTPRWLINQDGEYIQCYVGNGYMTNKISDTYDKWIFVAATFQNNGGAGTDLARFYGNGELIGEIDTITDTGDYDNLYFGTGYPGPGEGLMGYAGYWIDKILTQDEVTSLFNSGKGKPYSELTELEKTGLVGYWNMDEASGTRADSNGDNDLSDNNTVTSTTDLGTPGGGAAASFVGLRAEGLDSGATPVMDWTEGFTFSCWASNKGNIIFARDGFGQPAPKDGYREFIQLSGTAYAIEEGDVNDYITLTANPDASLGWTHMVFTWDPADGKLRYYQDNGVAVVSAGSITQLDQSPIPWTFGSWAGTFGTFYMGEVGVWKRVLTADEIAELYNSGAGKFYPFA